MSRQLLHLMTSLVLLAGPSLLAQQRDTVITSPPLTPNNGQSGITFEVEAVQPVDIVGLLNVFNTATSSASLWMRTGGVQHATGQAPNISTANGWNQVITNGTVTGANNNTPVALDFNSQRLNIPANTRIGFFIEGQTRYQTGTAADQTTYTDGILSVIVADNAAYGGGIPTPTFNPRRFLGAVIYERAGGCPGPANLQSTSQGCDSITMTWQSDSGQSFMIYGPQNFDPNSGGTNLGVVTSPHTVSGLISGTPYDFYVFDTCGTDSSYFLGPETVSTTGTVVSADFKATLGPVNANVRLVYFDGRNSKGALSYHWDFGDGNTGTGEKTSNFYQANGHYVVKLVIDGSSCGQDSITDTVVVEEINLPEWSQAARGIDLYPNPAHETLRLLLSDLDLRGTWRIVMYDLSGRKYREEMRQLEPAEGDLELDVSGLSSGVYLLLLERDGQAYRSSFAVR